MSANLINSAALAKAVWFQDLVRAALVEYALAHPTDALARSLVRDPSYYLPLFVSVLADNPTISADAWQTTDAAQQQTDVRYALGEAWGPLAGAIPNLEPRESRIPVLATDPDLSSEVSIWLTPAGVLRVRGDDGTAYEVG